MSKHAPNQVNPPADAPTDENLQRSQPAPLRKPFVRWRLMACALFMLALAGGYYFGHFARRVYLSRIEDANRSVVEEDVADATDPAAALPRPMLDPDSPLPTTVEALNQETLSAIEGLVQVFPDNPDALEMKARVQVWLGSSSQAEATWQQCLKLDPKYVHAYVGMASTAAKRAEHDESLELAQRALAVDPQNFQARAIAADALLQLGRAQEVPGVLEEYLGKDPRSRGHYLLGQAYAQLGDQEKARDNFAAAIRIYPDYREAYNGLAMACERLGEADKAKQAMDKFRELNWTPEQESAQIRESASTDLDVLRRDAAVFYTDAGRILYVGKKENAAEEFWLRAAALDPKNVPCRQSLAWFYHNAGRLGENIVWLKQLAALEPANPSYWTEIGRIYEKLRLMPAAEESFRKACEVAPENDAGFAALADLLLRFQQKLPETVDLARKAVQCQPSAPNYALLAAACRANQDPAGARTAIDQALKLAPSNSAYRAIRDTIETDPKR